MRKFTIFIGLMLMFTLFSVRPATGAPEQSPAAPIGNEQKNINKMKEVACECCKHCLAAKKPVKDKDEGSPATNGCQDCCNKCGRSEQITPEKIPPEIIERK